MEEENPCFEKVDNWQDCEELVGFSPFIPKATLGCELGDLYVHVLDHKFRKLTNEQKSLEAHYGQFVVSQAKPGAERANLQAYEMAYGPAFTEAQIDGKKAKLFELGEEPGPEDKDARMPSVISWADGDFHLLVASGVKEVSELLEVAQSLYKKD